MINVALVPPNPKAFDIPILHRLTPCHIGNIVEIALGVWFFIVDGGGKDSLADRQDVKMASVLPAAPSRWPVIDLVALIGIFLAYSPKTVLMAIVSVRSLSGVEVPWALMYSTSSGLKSRVLNGHPHATGCPITIGRWRSDMIGIAGISISGYFTVNSCSSLEGELQLLQNHNARPFPHHKPIPALFKGPRGFFRLVVSGGKGLHGIESTNGQRSDVGFRSAGDDGIGIPILDGPKGISDTVGPRGAGRHKTGVGSLGPKTDGNMTRGQIGYQHGNEERRNPTGPLLHKNLMILLKGRQPSQSRPDNNPDPIRILRSDLELGILHGFMGGSHRILNEEIHFFDLFLLNIEIRIEIFHLSSNFRLKPIRIESCDGTDP